MKIDKDHMYHGAALIQIAEHPQFTAINAFNFANRGRSRSAYRINDSIGVYLKYAVAPTPSHGEYVFTFNSEHLSELARLAGVAKGLFVALVCVKARQICCLRYDELNSLIAARKHAKGEDESQYQVLVVAPDGKGFRVYANRPGVKNKAIGKMRVNRSAFPDILFT